MMYRMSVRAQVCLAILIGLCAIVRSDPKITNGFNAAPGQFPHQVSLQVPAADCNTLVFRHICGGAIVTEKWIITAAHCATHELSQCGRVIAGTNDVYDYGYSQVRKVHKIIVHPAYRGSVGPFDLAMLRIQGNFNFTSVVKAIKLPKRGQSFNGIAMLSGWGSMSFTDYPILPRLLQGARLQIISDSSCATIFYQLNVVSKLDYASNICTLTQSNRASACSGDSGGPLISINDELIGVVSWGLVPCGRVGVPNVYTEVSNFIDFIEDTMNISTRSRSSLFLIALLFLTTKLHAFVSD